VHRAVALIIDIIIIALIFLAVIVVSMIAVLSQIEDVESWAASINPEEIAVRLSPEMAIFSLLTFALVILYFTLQEGGPNNATVGKKLMHIKVVDKNYQSINDTKALVRNVMRLWFFPQLSALILLLDIVLILVRPEKQRIGDMVANTYVSHTTCPRHRNTRPRQFNCNRQHELGTAINRRQMISHLCKLNIT